MARAQRKAMRPTWEGHLRLSLVTCPVALYTATERTADVHFNLINPKTNNRIRMQTIDAVTGRAVDRADLVKGFEVSKNKYILLDKDELDAVKLESTRIIDIQEFVDADAIDRIYWDEPYYLAPAGKTGIEAFAVIQAAMKKQGKVALGRLVLHQRERPCALEPRDGGILLTTLRTHGEIRSSAGVFDRHLPKPSTGMLDIAEKIIAQQEAKFDPTRFKDRYEDALRELIARKKKGQPVTAEAPEEKDEKVVDLMAALRDSLKGGGASRAKAERFMAAHKDKPKAKTRMKKKPSRKRAA
jgi:DNA end-binding protein Ku